jgi:hypothetical protein
MGAFFVFRRVLVKFLSKSVDFFLKFCEKQDFLGGVFKNSPETF